MGFQERGYIDPYFLYPLGPGQFTLQGLSHHVTNMETEALRLCSLPKDSITEGRSLEAGVLLS